jgi:hypothetical protein
MFDIHPVTGASISCSMLAEHSKLSGCAALVGSGGIGSAVRTWWSGNRAVSHELFGLPPCGEQLMQETPGAARTSALHVKCSLCDQSHLLGG